MLGQICTCQFAKLSQSFIYVLTFDSGILVIVSFTEYSHYLCPSWSLLSPWWVGWCTPWSRPVWHVFPRPTPVSWRGWPPVAPSYGCYPPPWTRETNTVQGAWYSTAGHYRLAPSAQYLPPSLCHTNKQNFSTNFHTNFHTNNSVIDSDTSSSNNTS